MGLPPSKAGGVQLTVACALPAVAVTAVGALGDVEFVATVVDWTAATRNAPATDAISALLTSAAV